MIPVEPGTIFHVPFSTHCAEWLIVDRNHTLRVDNFDRYQSLADHGHWSGVHLKQDCIGQIDYGDWLFL